MCSDQFIAAIVHAPDDEGSVLLARFALSARDRGYRVKGIIQRLLPNALSHKDSELYDLESRQGYRLFQNLGPGSSSCSVDNAGIAEASAALRKILAEDTDLAVINRFGSLEAENKGFAAEMLFLMSEGIPLLTLVSDQHLNAWRHFTGHVGVELPSESTAIENWFAALTQIRVSG